MATKGYGLTMRKGGGKQKGASFEREVCVKLSLWVSEGKQEDVFWRSAMSGGRSTVAARKGKRLASQAGDISCIHPVGAYFSSQYVVECKHYANLDFQALVYGKGKLAEFWHILETEAARCNKKPMLIAKQNRMPVLVCLDKCGIRDLLAKSLILIESPSLDLHIIDFKLMLNNTYPVEPETI